MDDGPTRELLEATHEFPGPYRIKAIGESGGDFAGRVIAAAVAELSEPGVSHSVRSTPGGRHVAVTLELAIERAEQVVALYARLREIEGLTMLL